ncbi:MAG TPA: DUF4340 domain-containing protein [Proteobacteria bacterium]|nr:DUF4340 domain-containing protein [Pseudomonadota bacterium]
MKKEFLLLLAVIVGLGALLFYQKKGKTNYQLPQLSAFSEVADRLLLEKGKERIELRREDEIWLIGAEKYRADGTRVASMLDKLKELQPVALISEKGNYQLYELDPEKRISVALYAGDKLLRRLEIGKSSASLRQSYIRLGEDPRVYQVLGNLQSNFFTTLDDLRDKQVLSITPEQRESLNEIVLERFADGKFESLKMIRLPLENQPVDEGRTESETPAETGAADPAGGLSTASAPVPGSPELSGWQLPDGSPVTASAVAELLDGLAGLKCESFLAERSGAEFSRPCYEFILRGAQDEFRLALLASEDGGYPAVSSAVAEPFRLSSWKGERLIRDFAVYTGPRPQSSGR